METKADVEHSEDITTNTDIILSNPPRVSPIWAYFASMGLILGWVAQVQLWSQIGTLLSTIVADLGSNKEYSWVFACFLFESAIVSPTIGAFADTWGRRWFVVLGNLIAIIGSVVCATAQSVNVVIIGMAIAGLGAAGQHFCYAAISEMFSRKHRGFVQGVLQFIPIPFTACGVLFAGEMAIHSTWKWAFYLNILISGLAFVMTFLFFDPPLPEKSKAFLSMSSYLKKLDWVAPTLSMCAYTGYALAGGFAVFRIYPWNDSRVLAPLFLGIAFFIAWTVRVYTYRGSNTLFPREIFNKEMVVLTLISCLISFSVYAATFTWSSEVQYVYTTDLIQVGKYSFPAGFGTELGICISGLFMRRLGRTNIQLTTACFFLTLFVALLSTLTPNGIRPGLAYLSLAGVANGFLEVLLPTMIQLTNPDRNIGAVSGMLITFRYVGGASSIIIALTVERSRTGSTLVPNLVKATSPLGLPETSLSLLLEGLEAANATLIEQVPGITPAIIEAATAALKNTYSDAFRIGYYPILALGVIATILAFFFAPDVTPRMDDSIAVFHGRPWFLRYGDEKTSASGRTSELDHDDIPGKEES